MHIVIEFLNKHSQSHAEISTGVTWSSTDEVLSCSDDHQILSWNLVSKDNAKLADLPEDLYPTSVHALPRIAGTGLTSRKNTGNADVILVTASDGKLYLLSKNGRIEKAIDAHRGAVLAGQWSPDATALVTAGEDGLLKIWSRNGMLRSTLATHSQPLYCVAWGPNSNQVLYSIGAHLVIKPLQPNSKPVQWKAHDGLILAVAWNTNNSMIISGSEDCRYKLWDIFGHILYASQINDYPITSVAWTPDGELFGVGSFNSLRLCDKTGWSYSLDKPQTQSIYSLEWSSDGTQVAGACGNGQVIFAHVINRRLEWKNYEVSMVGRKLVAVKNVTTDITETMDFQDSIIKVSMMFGHLIVVTSNHCYIYSKSNWNTPHMFDLREGSICLILQAERYFVLVESGGVYVYTYDGKFVCAPKWVGMRPDMLNHFTVALSNALLAVRDKADEKVVYLFDIRTGKPAGDGKPYTHKIEVTQVGIDQCAPSIHRRLAIIDKNKDLYLVSLRDGKTLQSIKLGVMTGSLCWNDASSILVSLQEGKLMIWNHPDVAWIDRSLLPSTITEKEMTDLGYNPHIVSFLGSTVLVRRTDGSLVSFAFPPYAAILHGYVASSRWDDALRLCRFVKLPTLWGCLAAMALGARELHTAEAAYAAIEEVDKVLYLQYIKSQQSSQVQTAELALLCGNQKEAENILLQNKLWFRAIMMNISLHEWERALNLAVKYNTHIDTVLGHRISSLERLGKQENNAVFLKYNKEVKVDWAKINAAMADEYEKEKYG
ncbi:intraflagellar transport protein 80 homolog isoform X1 [Dermacentor andersoni]|uniref:intraflagellar transport protein 80 homolog isoform X1 n=1 Tax=Dermacentor andersoni TaxID=34620 RepID=UPI003B3B7AFA